MNEIKGERNIRFTLVNKIYYAHFIMCSLKYEIQEQPTSPEGTINFYCLEQEVGSAPS